VQALEHAGVVRMEGQVSAQLAHVHYGERGGQVVAALSDAVREGAEALERGDLAVLVAEDVAEIAVDLAERRGECLEIEPVPVHTRVMQEPVGRRNAPPADLDERQSLHVDVDQRVEQVERDGADRHAAQDTRVRWIVKGENLDVLRALPDARVALCYVDPPFNTGRTRKHTRLRTRRDPGGGDRTGFGGQRYTTEVVGVSQFEDRFTDLPAYLEPRLREARRVLRSDGSLFVHLDPRESHYVKVLLDGIVGRASFVNEIVWAYDYGARTRRRWPAKHDTILVYVRTPGAHHFDCDQVDREPYMAPGLVSAEKAARGKRPTDVWFHTIVPTNGREKTGYPTQKPEGVLRRMVAASSRPGGWCLDPFAGSGTLGAVCQSLGRRFVLIDDNPEAVEVMRQRLAAAA